MNNKLSFIVIAVLLIAGHTSFGGKQVKNIKKFDANWPAYPIQKKIKGNGPAYKNVQLEKLTLSRICTKSQWIFFKGCSYREIFNSIPVNMAVWWDGDLNRELPDKTYIDNRLTVATEMVGYNQPPLPGFYFGSDMKP